MGRCLHRAAVCLAVLLLAGCGRSPGDLPGGDSIDDSTASSLLTSTFGAVPDLPEGGTGRVADAFAKAKTLLRSGSEKIADSTVAPPDREELEKVGGIIVRQATQGLALTDDAGARARVDRVLARLVAVLPKDSVNHYRFDVYASDQVNAFMATGGRGVVFTGLLAAMPEDDELASVLAHELSHGELGHADHSYRLARAGAKIGERFGEATAETLEKLAGRFLTSVYDQDMEFEADRLGFVLAWRAGFGTKGAEKALKILDTLGGPSRAPGGGARRVVYDIKATHPPTPDRIAYVERLAGLLAARRK